MSKRNHHRIIKKEITEWILSNLEIFLALMQVSKTDFAHLLGETRESLWHVLSGRYKLSGKWVIAVFFAIDYICSKKYEEGKSNTKEYETALNLIEPMAYYARHIEEIYED